MTDTSFVRTEMLLEQDPPATSVGILGWMRTNLFSGWLNSLLTVFALVAIYYVFAGLFPWLFQSVGKYDSLNDCREIFIATYLETEGHACWAVINERWLQLLYGFYPSDSYWRPNLAFVLLLLAIAPVLFAEYVPRKLLYLTAAYPFILPFLMWGGSIFGPILVVLGLAVGYGVFRLVGKYSTTLFALPAGIVAALVWWMFLLAPVSHAINTVIGNTRTESTVVRLNGEIETSQSLIAELQNQLDNLAEQISDAETAKDETYESLEALIAPALDEELTGDERQQEIDEVLSLPQYASLRGVLVSRFDSLTALRASTSQIARDKGRLESGVGGSRTLLTRIKELPQVIERLPERREIADALRDALPGSVASYVSVAQARADNSEISPSDLDELAGAVSAENAVLADERAVTNTYAALGRIGLAPTKSRDFGGFMLSILIGVVAIGVSLPIGIVLALGRQSDLMIVKAICVGFIEFIRGVPLITLLFVASTLLNIFLPPGTNFDIILRVMIMVTLFASAYMAEVIRGGLAALDRGQYEGADSLGLDYWQAQRLIIMPQALKISIPGIVSTFIGIFKDTTLVSIIGLLDPLGLTNAIRADSAWNGVYWELFVFVAALFWVFCFSMSRYSMYLERKLQTDHR